MGPANPARLRALTPIPESERFAPASITTTLSLFNSAANAIASAANQDRATVDCGVCAATGVPADIAARRSAQSARLCVRRTTLVPLRGRRNCRMRRRRRRWWRRRWRPRRHRHSCLHADHRQHVNYAGSTSAPLQIPRAVAEACVAAALGGGRLWARTATQTTEFILCLRPRKKKRPPQKAAATRANLTVPRVN